jgi:hypothetical protein
MNPQIAGSNTWIAHENCHEESLHFKRRSSILVLFQRQWAGYTWSAIREWAKLVSRRPFMIIRSFYDGPPTLEQSEIAIVIAM